MYNYRFLLIVFLFIAFEAYASSPFSHCLCCDGGNSRYDIELNTRDWEKLSQFISSKQEDDSSESARNLSVSGDIRMEWRHSDEKGFHGGEKCLRNSKNDLDVLFDLYLNYACDNLWAIAQVQFDQTSEFSSKSHCNSNGSCCTLWLKKAYIGYSLCSSDDTRLDIEIGRRNLYNVFDSEVQFLSRFDGILLSYSSKWKNIADWYVYLAGFTAEESFNRAGWVTEFGLQNIYDIGLDLEYSFIDWLKSENKHSCWKFFKGKFLVSQFTCHYHLDRELLPKNIPAQVYGAFLINHAAGKIHQFHGKKNNGWYIGFRVGEVFKKCDWAFDVQYQYVQAQAIPGRDVSGIGRQSGICGCCSHCNRENTNYKGWRIEGLYALTDNLALDARFEASKEIDKLIGGPSHFFQLRLELLYAF